MEYPQLLLVNTIKVVDFPASYESLPEVIMCPFDLECSHLHVQKSHEEYILDKAAELGVSWRQ